MKKTFLIIFFVVLLCCLYSIQFEKNNNVMSEFIVFDRGDNYLVYKKKDSFVYYYEIVHDSKILYKSEQLEQFPIFYDLGDDILEVKLNYGSNANKTKYFDLNKNQQSIEYYNVLATDGKRCVYINKKKIIISNIFNCDEKYEYEMDVLLLPTAIKEVYFVNEKLLKVIYHDEYGLVKEILIAL